MYANDHTRCIDMSAHMQYMYIYIDAVYLDTVKISIHADTFVAVCTYSAYSLSININIYIYTYLHVYIP